MVTERDRTEIERVYGLQEANRWRVAASTAGDRIARLKRLRDALWAHRDAMHAALQEDFGKHPGESDLTEFMPMIGELNHTIRHLSSWMKPQRASTPRLLLGTRSEIRSEPRGLVLILSPWNYPVNLLVSPLVAALAAGNCVIAKPSSKVPRTSRFLKELLAGVFPVEDVAVFEGGPEVSEALLEKRFDHVFFTGSTRVGRSVAAAAARHLSTTTLELGGKSPAIVDASACLEKAAERILWGKFINAGQTCVAPDHVLIHEDALSGFLEHARRILSTRYGATPEARRECPSFCRLVSGGHLRGLAALLDAAKAEGAKVAFGGGMDPAQRYMEPTLVTGVLPGSPLMREELFGPVLPILTFRDLDEAIRLVREGEKPLALYVFAESRDAVERVLRGTTAGGTSVNTVMVHLANPELPFGGVGESGMGSYHGRHGFRTFSHERAVLRQGPLDTLRMFYPPYTEAVQGLLRKAMRFLA